MSWGKRLGISVASLAGGVALALLASGAMAGTNHRQVTVFTEEGTLSIGGGDTADIVEISGRSNRRMKVQSGQSIAELSDDCKYKTNFDVIVCDVTDIAHVVADMGGEADQVVVEEEFDMLTVRGATGGDLLIGHKGDEKIQGGAEGDLLDGRGGKDKVDGGDGDDTCADRPGDRVRNCEFIE
jgi:Ca2+-binding RTX toxin-like protein